MKIQRLSVSVEPVLFDDRRAELRCTVQLPRRLEVVSIKCYDISDFDSHYDFLFEEVKRQLLSEIRKLEKSQTTEYPGGGA